MRVTIEKKTDQLNYEDFPGDTTRTVTIAGVRAGTKEQQYDIAIEGDRRVWRPAVTMLKLLVAAWGDDATVWTGRSVTLYGDHEVRFGPDVVGGIRVSRMSHLPDDKPLTVRVSKTRGKRVSITVQPLADTPAPLPEPTAEQVAASTDVDQLREWYRRSGPERQAEIKARVADLPKEK